MHRNNSRDLIAPQMNSYWVICLSISSSLWLFLGIWLWFEVIIPNNFTCNTMQSNAIHHNEMQCNVMQSNAIHHNAMQCNATLIQKSALYNGSTAFSAWNMFNTSKLYLSCTQPWKVCQCSPSQRFNSRRSHARFRCKRKHVRMSRAGQFITNWTCSNWLTGNPAISLLQLSSLDTMKLHGYWSRETFR